MVDESHLKSVQSMNHVKMRLTSVGLSHVQSTAIHNGTADCIAGFRVQWGNPHAPMPEVHDMMQQGRGLIKEGKDAEGGFRPRINHHA